MELSSGATLAMNWEGWMWAQYLSADEETQAVWRESKREMDQGKKDMWERESGKDGKRGGKGKDSDSEDSDDSDDSDDEEMEMDEEATEEFAL